MTTDKKIRFIYSSKAGKGRIKPDFIRERIDESIDLSISHTASDVADMARDWANRYAESGLLYVWGGDGSINEVAAAIYGTGAAMGVIPGGTGNDFARYLYKNNINKKLIERLLASLTEPDIRPVDLLSVNGRIGINAFSLGEDTVILEKSYAFKEAHPALSGLSFIAGAFKHFIETSFKLNYTPLDFKVIDERGREESFQDDLVLGAASNGQYYGGGFRPAPNASIEDGILDLVYAGRVGAGQMLGLILPFRKGTHLKSPVFRYRKIQKLTIKASDGRELTVNLDGEIMKGKSFELEVLPAALPMAFL